MHDTLNIRIEDTLKSSLQKLADHYGATLSDYLREVLQNHLDDFNGEDPSIIDEDTLDTREHPAPIPYERTYEFTCLLTWLFCRKMHPQDNNPKTVHTSFKLKVEKVLSESSFSNELKLEFLKILGDLNRYLLESDYENKQFQFPVPSHHLSFNYYLLMNEIWSLKTPML
jgi:predicted DNA-binding protein